MQTFYTSPVIICDGAVNLARQYLSQQFGLYGNVIAVCDANTEAIALSEFSAAERFVFPDGVISDPELTKPLEDYAAGKKALIAVGSGTIHDLTRYTAGKLGIPFISFPTAPSVDGFTSGIAALTVAGQKLSVPSSPPAALFAEPAVFLSGPPSLTASGVGDMIGKYISLFDWRISAAVTGESLDYEIYKLEQSALKTVVSAEPSSRGFGLRLMRALVTSGLAIQAFGSSRPVSGSEHHISHLWEMNCINNKTPAMHGERVGAATLMLLGLYRKAKEFKQKKNNYSREYLLPVFGQMTDGILRENLPDPLAEIDQKCLDRKKDELLEEIALLPKESDVKSFMDACGCKTSVASLGLPDTLDFTRLTLEVAPYVRRRVTMLKLCRFS